MPINSCTIVEGATCSVTGGTAKTFKANGSVVKGGVQVVDTSVTDARVRPSLTFTARPAVQSADGKTWSFERRETVYIRPKLLANGTVAFNSVRVIVNFHPESSAAEVAELFNSSAQINFDTDFADFRNIGSLG